MASKTKNTTPTVTPSAPELAVKSSRMPKITPTKPRVNISTPSIDLGEIPNLQIIDEQGHVPDPSLDPDLDPKELLRVYRAMILTRVFDDRMLKMQRQGEMGTFAPGIGQEATQIGQVYPLQENDWFSPSYRSFGAQIWRGWPMDQLMLLWDGFFEGFAPPEGVNDLPFSIVIGSHVAVATGVAMAAKFRHDDSVMVTNFGDGAFSQGIVAESLSFAAVYDAPIVFICENNGYAISMPVQKQAGTDYLAGRGVGLGVPSMRVDGNDPLAMIAATRDAVDRARRGDGPTLLEAVTYRMGVHTTADDPRAYRDDDEVAKWRKRCPIARFEVYLKDRKLLDDDAITAIAAECDEEVLAARESFRAQAVAKPREVFDYVYESLPPELAAQHAEYLAKLDRRGIE